MECDSARAESSRKKYADFAVIVEQGHGDRVFQVTQGAVRRCRRGAFAQADGAATPTSFLVHARFVRVREALSRAMTERMKCPPHPHADGRW